MEKGTVGIPGDYFLKMAKHDYANYRTALAREFYQNSIDAGATEIHVTTDNSNRSITITDNGCGMSRETLLTKLLVLGGSEKAQGSIGAFGKAKELLFFSWEKYEIRTNDLLVEGAGAEYTISANSQTKGTEVKIWIQKDEYFQDLEDAFGVVANYMETDCSIYINNEKINCLYPKGEFVKSFANLGDIYVNNDITPTGYAKVRISGIWMFDWYVGDAPAITLELNKDSITCLTSNRDGLKGGYPAEIQALFKQLAANRRSMLFPEKEEITIHVEGTEKSLSIHDLEFLEKAFGNVNCADYAEGFSRFVAMKADLDQTLTQMRVEHTDPYDYTRLKYFGFKWDSLHKFEKSMEIEAKDFLDGSRAKSKKAQKLLTLWGETIKQICLDTEKYIEFKVGFSWNDNIQAEYSTKNSIHLFLLNPNVLEIYPDRKMLARKLKLLACHEITHITEKYHDEYFMNKMEDLIERTWKSDKIYNQITKIGTNL